MNATLSGPNRGGPSRPRRSASQAPRAESPAKMLNTRSSHTPTDIGDQYLKFRPALPGVTFTSMCQNFHQPAPRSAVRSTGHKRIRTNEA